MTTDENEPREDNRAKKLKGRAKRRKFGQGTRTYLHAMINSMARRAAGKRKEPS